MHRARKEFIGTTKPDGVSPETAIKVLERDGWKCRRCGVSDPYELTLHHIIFRSELGGDEEDNLVTLCHRHHEAFHDGLLQLIKHKGTFFFKGIQ